MNGLDIDIDLGYLEYTYLPFFRKDMQSASAREAQHHQFKLPSIDPIPGNGVPSCQLSAEVQSANTRV
jgi:hypothetical protein